LSARQWLDVLLIIASAAVVVLLPTVAQVGHEARLVWKQIHVDETSAVKHRVLHFYEDEVVRP